MSLYSFSFATNTRCCDKKSIGCKINYKNMHSMPQRRRKKYVNNDVPSTSNSTQKIAKDKKLKKNVKLPLVA